MAHGSKKQNKGQTLSQHGRRLIPIDEVIVMQNSVSKKAKAQNPQQQGKKGRSTASRAAVSKLIKENVGSLDTTGIHHLLGQYVDPASHQPCRLPDVSSASCVGTALSSLFVVDTLNWTSSVPAIADCPTFGFLRQEIEPIIADPNNRMVVAMRDPVVLGLVSAGPWAAGAANKSVYSNTTFFWNSTTPLYAEIPFNEHHQLPLEPLLHGSGPLRYGDFMVPGLVSDGEVQVVWIDASVAQPATFLIEFHLYSSNSSTYFDCRISADLWGDEHTSEEVVSAQSTLPANTLDWSSPTLSITSSGYYSFAAQFTPYQENLQPNKIKSIVYSISTQTAISFDHIVHPSVIDAVMSKRKKGLIGQGRVLGSAVLISNNTATMFKAGTVYAKQIDARDPWYDDTSSPEAFSTTNVAASYDGPLSKGLFAIVKPQGPSAFDLLEIVDSNSEMSRLGFRPFLGCGTVCSLLVPGEFGSGGYYPSTSLTIHWARGFEFTTQNQLFLVDVSDIRRVDMLNFMDELARFKQFYENPLHLKDIGALMKRAGLWTWENKAAIAEVAKLLASIIQVVKATAMA